MRNGGQILHRRSVCVHRRRDYIVSALVFRTRNCEGGQYGGKGEEYAVHSQMLPGNKEYLQCHSYILSLLDKVVTETYPGQTRL